MVSSPSCINCVRRRVRPDRKWTAHGALAVTACPRQFEIVQGDAETRPLQVPNLPCNSETVAIGVAVTLPLIVPATQTTSPRPRDGDRRIMPLRHHPPRRN